MNTLTKTMSPSEMDALYQRIKPVSKQESQPSYTKWQLKTSDMTVTAYTSGKVVFQGRDVSWLADDKPASSSSHTAQESSRASVFPMAGSDEVGTGDYFGPIVVAAVIVPDQKTADALKALHITDSKAMTDQAILKTAPKVAELVEHSIEMLPNKHYNKIWNPDSMNINRIKSLMHNRSYLDLAKKGPLPKNRIIDQFCMPHKYYQHVSAVRKEPDIIKGFHFETKAESKYIAVAAASVLARYAFLQAMDAQDKQYNFHFVKGAGAKADACGVQLLKERPDIQLSDVAKLHFANTSKIQAKLDGEK